MVKSKRTIRKKFFISFSCLFLLAAFVFYQIVVASLEKNTYEKIEKDLVHLQNLTTEYIRQFQEIHSGEKDVFNEYAVEITTKLGQLNKQSVALFNQKGEFNYQYIPVESAVLMSKNQFEPNMEMDKRVAQAFDNQAIYQLEQVDDSTLLVFTFPIYIYGELLGVIRYTSDFTEVIQQNNELLNKLLLLTVTLFVGVFIISFILINKITKPLAMLSNWTKKMVAGDYKQGITIKTNDEVGTLASNFNEMQKSINDYVTQLELDKQKIMELEQQRTEFFHHITHELKTPLTTISGYAQIIGEDNFDDYEFLKVAANRMNGEAVRLHQLVSTILDQTKSAHLKPKKFFLNLLVQEVVEYLQPYACEKNITFHLQLTNKEIYGVQEEWKRIVINLLENSLKHGKAGSVVLVEVGEEIIIKNDVESINEKTVQRLFEPFNYSTRQDSHGLGLFIVKQLVVKNEAAIQAEVTETSFKICIVFNNLETIHGKAETTID